MIPEPTLYTVKAVLILDKEGKRVFAKYYKAPHDPLAISSVSSKVDTTKKKSDSKTANGTTTQEASALSASVKDQKAFEKGLFAKTNKQAADIVLYEDTAVVAYKQVEDVVLYVVGNTIDENEIMLYNTMICLRDAITILLSHSFNKKSILENYDLVTLAADECIDSGIILESDPMVLANRVSKAPANEPTINNIELSEQGLLNVYQFARGKLSQKLREQFQ